MEELSVILLVILGAVLSLAFKYFPGLKTWYERQSGYKAGIMLAVLLLVSLAYFGLACTSFAVRLGITVPCTADGALTVALGFIYAIVGNQSAFLLSGGQSPKG